SNCDGDMVGKAMPALAGVLKGFSDNLPAIEAFVGNLVDKVSPAISGVVGTVRDEWPTIKAIVGGVVDWWLDNVWPIWTGTARIVRDMAASIAATFQEHS